MFDNLRKKLAKFLSPSTDYMDMLSYSSPIITMGNTEYFSTDVIKQAISCVVYELKKTAPTHVRTQNGDDNPLGYSGLQPLLDNPNEYMTTSQFLEKTYWLLFLNYNAFIIPTYDIKIDENGFKHKKYTGLYPVQPQSVELLQDKKGNLGIRFKFANGYESLLDYNDVIHLRLQYSQHEFMGGTSSGKPDNKGLIQMAQLNDELIKGVAKSLKASYSVNGIVKYNSYLDEEKTQRAIKELEKKLNANQSGLLPLDLKAEYIPLNRDLKLVDKDTLQFIDEKLLRYYGVSLPILTGDYSAEQHGAFYQRACEHIIIDTGQEFTKKLFTERERSFGNKIVLYPNELYFMDTSQKLELFDLLVDTESCYKNELRTAFGMKPLAELTGQLAMSSNKHNAVNNDKEETDLPENVNENNDEKGNVNENNETGS